MKRRDLLASAVGAGVLGSALSGCEDYGAAEMPKAPPPSTGPDGTRRFAWQNWSGYQYCVPDARIAPADENELAELLRASTGPIRPVGAGHSFTPLVPTEGTLLSMRHFEGLRTHDATRLSASFGAGTKLGQIGPALDGIGQALRNMPDIDEQSLAGALATATHGTGAGLGALHSFVSHLKLMTPNGQLIECSREHNSALFDAARVSLGSLGVITELTLDNVATHRLKRKVWLEPLEDLLERFDDLAAAHHSFEIYFLPNCDFGVAITIDPTDEPLSPRRVESDNDAVMKMKQLRDAMSWWPSGRRWLLNKALQEFQGEEAVDVWYQIFPSNRAVRFNEMEYHLPREALLPTLRKVKARVESTHPEVFFPIEVRVVKGDDAWLSPFYAHESSGSIAVHRYHEEDPLPYFRDIEPLYQTVGGRPHWGKMHTLDASVLSQRYPRWRDFLEVRAELDPQRKMLNPYLERLFGLEPT